MKYDFPGNVRELENIIQQAVILTPGKMTNNVDLPAVLSEKQAAAITENNEIPGDLNESVAGLEKAMIQSALNKTDVNQLRASESVNISERTIRYKIAKYKINS